jgi:predicted AlkP superfamily phosphohydrolase/phosphomutase
VQGREPQGTVAPEAAAALCAEITAKLEALPDEHGQPLGTRVFLNVRGREPDGVIDAADYDRVRNEIAAKLEALVDHEGKPMGTKVFKPEQIYRATNNVAPDLIVYFGDLNWRSVGSLGGGEIYTFENDTGPDDANHAEFGIFIMAGAGIAPGERSGLRITDVGPTVLQRTGAAIPTEMIGAPLA